MMRSSSFAKICGVTLVAALLIMSGALGVGAQGTAEGTAAPSVEPTVVATTEATSAATAALPAATRFPACPGTFLTPATAVESTAEATAAPTLPPDAEFTPGYLGIAAQTVDACGARVTEIIPGSPADQAGLQLGDIIVGYNNNPLPDRDTLRDYVIASRPGDQVEIVVKRGADEVSIILIVGSRPQEAAPTEVATEAATAAVTAEATQAQ